MYFVVRHMMPFFLACSPGCGRPLEAHCHPRAEPAFALPASGDADGCGGRRRVSTGRAPERRRDHPTVRPWRLRERRDDIANIAARPTLILKV
jgi:hypothetical protein